MKNIILSILLLSGCATDRNILTDSEMNNWSNRNDTIFYKNDPVAFFTHYEIELYNGKTDRELCLSELKLDTIDRGYDIIKYVHTKHPKNKVQFKPYYPQK